MIDNAVIRYIGDGSIIYTNEIDKINLNSHTFQYSTLWTKDKKYTGYIGRNNDLYVYYNSVKKTRIYFKPKEKKIQSFVEAIEKEKEYVWPDLNMKKKPMGMKCNYKNDLFRLEVKRVKNYFRVIIHKYLKLEPSYSLRKKKKTIIVNKEDLSDLLSIAKMELL